MKKTAITTLALLLACFAFSAPVSVPTIVESVTIYHSGALVNRTGTPDLAPGVHELTFENLSSKIVLNSLKISNKEVTILNRSLMRKLTTEEYARLQDTKAALNKQMALIEAKYNEPGFVAKVEDLEKMSSFYAREMLRIKRELREIDLKIEEARKLENTELKNENAAILKLIVSVETQLKTPLRMLYVCGGIGWSPAYEISVESPSNKTIAVKYLAKVMSQCGEDWENVAIRLSSSFPLESPTQLPRPDGPWLLEGGNYGGTRAHYQQYTGLANQENALAQQEKDIQLDSLKGVEYESIRIPSFLKLRTLEGKYTLKSNSTVFTFPVKNVNLPASYYYYAFPGMDTETYLVAEVTGWDTLGFVDGVANITFGGNDVGKSVIRFSESKDTLLLPVGKDNSVYLKRSEIADQKYFKMTTVSKKRQTTLAYQYELKNNNPFPIRFELADQVPVSQTKYASVEVEKTTDGKMNNETGEVTWYFDLKPGESIKKELIFTIETDEEYGYYHQGPARAKYKTISAPKF